MLLAASTVAHGEPMDLALERLLLNPDCVSADGTGRFQPPGAANCRPDNQAFKRLVSQLGFALAPNAMNAARTTGLGGFHVAVEASYTSLSNDADYWKRGTEGARDPATQRAPSSNQSPASLLQQYALKVRKGFGFGLELAGVVGFLPKTSLVNGGADVRLAVLEGFRNGRLGIFPDLSVGGGVRTITGSAELKLTTVALDVKISKPITIADSSLLTPWLGYQYVWIFGDSGLIDLTPGTNALAACGYAGQNVPGTAAPNQPSASGSGSVSNVYDGQPVCRSGSGRDFNNNVVFEPVRVHRQRLLLGVSYRYERVLAGAQLMTDLLRASDANSGATQRALAGEARQWTAALELGVVF